MICEKRPRTEAELAAAATKTQIPKENGVKDLKAWVLWQIQEIEVEDMGVTVLDFHGLLMVQKGDNRREGQQKGGNSVGLQGNKQGNFEKGESSGVIKNGNGVAGKNINGGDGIKGKVSTVVNNSGSLELIKKEERNKDKANVDDGKSQAAV
ncbi:hypothetical protein L6452_43407 [Arctium lappa]|uniref:Uncharacterized protein n=1 Tax=Arctium lappa TaxID=4217 RepID=A0ACB8XCF3_ARCLA|nr:hypothetical protein L6452_43407 [Arctium lappa]